MSVGTEQVVVSACRWVVSVCLRCGSIELESWRVRAEGRGICKCDGMKYRRWERDGKRSERFETCAALLYDRNGCSCFPRKLVLLHMILYLQLAN